MDKRELRNAIRIRRLRLLMAELGYSQIREFAERLDRNPNYFSRLLNTKGTATDKDRKRLGEDLAREIEEKTGKPRGWLDRDDDGAGSGHAPASVTNSWPFKIEYRRFAGLNSKNKRTIEVLVERLVLEFEGERETRQKRRAS